MNNDIEINALIMAIAIRSRSGIWRQKNRLRMYVGGQKVWDLTNAFQEAKYNSFMFYIADYNNAEDRYYISNLYLAEATGDTRHKLLETGTFTPNDILFDSGKAKPNRLQKTLQKMVKSKTVG